MKHVLIIDDEDNIGEEFLDFLEIMGHRGHYFSNPIEGLLSLKENTDYFDTIFVDLMMPEMSGRTFIKAARKLTNKSTEYFLMSGVPELDLDDLVNSNEAKFIHKPLSLSFLKGVFS